MGLCHLFSFREKATKLFPHSGDPITELGVGGGGGIWLGKGEKIRKISHEEERERRRRRKEGGDWKPDTKRRRLVSKGRKERRTFMFSFN